MKHLTRLGLALLTLLPLATACGSGDEPLFPSSGGTGGSSTSSTMSTSSGDAGGSGGTASSGTNGSGAGGNTGSGGGMGTGGSSGTGGNTGMVYDPDKDGPYAYTEIDDPSFKSPATMNTVPMHCAYPTSGPSAGPYPVVVVAHGFQIDASRYYGYVKRLASFGYVAIAPNYPTPNPFNPLEKQNHVNNAKDFASALDWAKNKPELAGKVDVNKAGATGHSLGGKLALYAAMQDPRFKAAITLDPVDGSTNCNPTDCPDVSSKMSTLNIPTGFLGETNDATGGFMACAPAADNYTTFYAGSKPPSLEVTVIPAKHMSFIDDPTPDFNTCVACNACQSVPQPQHDQIVALARAYVVAFYERHLRGNTAYDTYLTGAEAQMRYVTPGLITIKTK